MAVATCLGKELNREWSWATQESTEQGGNKGWGLLKLPQEAGS